MSVRILVGDVRERLAELPDDSVHCVVTSPPYYGLRDYGVDGQIGLEPTLTAYIETMVDVFRGVRRVLRSDGVCWLNIGDSYAGGATGQTGRNDGGRPEKDRGWAEYDIERTKIKVSHGLKPKDLMMVPARLALALQQPYYTGRIKSEADRIWLAAMIDAEGCMFIHKRKAGQSNGQGYVRQNATYSMGLEVSNTSEAVVQRCMAIAGKGSICTQGPNENHRRKQMLYRWNLRSNECREIIREIYPYLVAKKQQARIMLGCPPSGEKAEASHEAMRHLHNGVSTSVDFPEPASMFEPGWFVRSDVIWKKPNPMPESVTDRPTNAHEHIFLLTKSARYWYDADAVRVELADTNQQSSQPPVDTRSRYGTGGGNTGFAGTKARMLAGTYPGANLRNVWSISTVGYPGAHFATFPPEIPRRCIKAGTSEHGCCSACGAPWSRVVERSELLGEARIQQTERPAAAIRGVSESSMLRTNGRTYRENTTTGWQPGCTCDADVIPCTVMDIFFGSGTTGLVADQLGRDCIGIELNPAYASMAEDRIRAAAPMFAEVSA